MASKVLGTCTYITILIHDIVHVPQFWALHNIKLRYDSPHSAAANDRAQQISVLLQRTRTILAIIAQANRWQHNVYTLTAADFHENFSFIQCLLPTL